MSTLPIRSGLPDSEGVSRITTKWMAGVAFVSALLVGCSSEPVRVDPMRPRTVTVTVSAQTESPEQTKQPRPPHPPQPGLSGVGCADSGAAIGFRLSLVVRVIDGDTVEVQHGGSDRIIEVRLIGIGTPEIEPVECYGPEASAFTERWLEGRLVKLEYDKERIDPYGRTLAFIITEDGQLFNEMLVWWGFATVTTYLPNAKHVQAFERAERRARDQSLGLWSV
jgi:micrococcal nuclease